jgi:hypothetical protein
MNWFILLYTLLLLLQWIWNITEKKDQQLLNTSLEGKGVSKRGVAYLSNDKILIKSLRKHYELILGLEDEKEIYPDKINFRFYKQLDFLQEDVLLGYKIKYTQKDIESARDYLHDLSEYLTHTN